MDSRLHGNDKQQISVLISVNPCLTESYLKKQSQFASISIGVSTYLKGYYGLFYDRWTTKNKAKRTQYTGFPPARE